ncbi:unnamed protein product [Schistosoma rodhaini]|uniref:Uncharacterized protein n=1 Tax=Schistosoma mansoni TaxID=6183 RepID=G4VBI8_SCHMA|nr:hypothetical protein Smp_047400 [Schistosoma mansoni]CAH8526039.1 unnamed protein product [Schistosoma rodhaini]|eukprot:XP_018649886.1 hypothetical protein Smp_047400 [Schistosoma mansoni]
MGNYVNFRSSPPVKQTDKLLTPIKIPKHSKVLDLDPRSPSDGIVRTPIQIDKDDPSSPSNVTRTPVRYSNGLSPGIPCFNNYETPDGVLTEDDSIHRGNKSSSLSDTEVAHNTKTKTRTCDSNSKFRLSWFGKRIKRKSLYDSPGLYVRFRHKQNYEKCMKKEQQVYKENVTDPTGIS